MSKTEVVKNIINSNKDGKFILFSEFSNTFDMIQNALKEANIPFAEVKGTSDMKQKYIRLFKEGKLTVLFLNSRNDGSGIDLPEATDVILYHKMSSKDIETQVLGRALRLGRTKPLTVHRLLYKDEEQMDDNVRNLGHLHRSHLPPSHESEDNNEQQEYQRRLREEQEQEDRELAMRLQAELNT
jgi:SNF2 family DNA or RNA helicase